MATPNQPCTPSRSCQFDSCNAPTERTVRKANGSLVGHYCLPHAHTMATNTPHTLYAVSPGRPLPCAP
jgi:hypothetical protein